MRGSWPHASSTTMPELPEVETVMAGLAPELTGLRLTGARLRQRQLRWPVPRDLAARVRGAQVLGMRRRGKYLLVQTDRGWLIVHLGMSGSLRLVPSVLPPGPHDHLDLLLDDGRALRFTDPRRFGCLLFSDDPWNHPLIAPLGIEPLSETFDGDALYDLSRGRRVSIKDLLMNAHLIVGIGNIYANESLFEAGIDPRLAAGRLSRRRCGLLAAAVQSVLRRAIVAGGSSIRDFVGVDGRPGYFQQGHAVYGRDGETCGSCGTLIRQMRQGGRSTYLCPHCQKR